ncbi:tetratricopeptide repeat protein [Puteibacter caeruleilacunae]|nr:tetratricopeptide repeat protein [Puteibacter caeruleilacunae]
MKRLILLVLLIPFFTMHKVAAQSVQVYRVSLDESTAASTPFTKTKYYLKSFENKGTQTNKVLEETVENYIKNLHFPIDDQKPWINQPWIVPVANESEADIILKGEYIYTCQAVEGETKFRESATKARLPYFVTSTENKADISVVFTFEYKDGSPTKTDTIASAQRSLRAPGKKYTPLDVLDEKVTKAVVREIKYYTNVRSSDKVVLNFPKVKLKDKSLKAKYASIKDLYKARKYVEAAKVVKELYDQQPSPELAHALGISYELIGNFPKAEEFYKIKTDFHANVRMKKNKALLDYATSIGYTPIYIDL